MKKKYEVECDICDFCQTDNKSAWMKCIGCGTVACRDCQESGKLIALQARLHSQMGDFHVCQGCEAKMKAGDLSISSSVRKLYEALLVIGRLEREYSGFFADFEPRREAAEKRVADLTERK